jgi:hypothetical protein
VQHIIPEYLRWGLKVQTFSRCIIVFLDQFGEPIVSEDCQISFSGQGSAHPADGVLNASLLPWRIGITEEGLDIELVEFVVESELGAVVKGDCLAPGGRQWLQDVFDGCSDRFGCFAWWPNSDEQAGVPFVQSENGLSIDSEQHQVSFPMSRCLTVIGQFGSFADRMAVSDEGGGTAAFTTSPATFGLATRQVMSPAVVFGTSHLRVDEPVDGLVGKHLHLGLPGKPSGNLLRRPAA